MVLPAVRRLYGLLALRPYSAIVAGALVCTLLAKFFHAYRASLLGEYFGWVLADIAALLLIEVVFALICFRRPGRAVLRIVTFLAAIICTWSVMSAGWLIRTGTQILPRVLLPLFRDPLNSFPIVGVNLIKTPRAAACLLIPSAVALAFFFAVMARPRQPNYNRKRFTKRVAATLAVVLVAVAVRGFVVRHSSTEAASAGLRLNCQVRAIISLLIPDSDRLGRADFAGATRELPTFDEIKLSLKDDGPRHNVVIVILEGVQRGQTSLGCREAGLTPFMVQLAGQGVEFTNARSTLTHTTKALFTLLTGRFPSASQDIAETVPMKKPYASLATILKNELGFRTAFFQSAKGNFESRPGLVSNLGFDKFWARDDLDDPNCFLGYLGCDEFAMIGPIVQWIGAGQKPFLVTVMCSVTHDPYELPQRFGEPAKQPLERFRRTVAYTDKFLAALDEELERLNIGDDTIFCVVADHGEAFGEHGQLGHERIAFDEVLHIPWVMRVPCPAEPGGKVTEPVSSVDLTPTLLGLLGFETEGAGFDGINALGDIPDNRKVYFSGWMHEGPAGFVRGGRKFMYNPTNETVWVYDLSAEPPESVRMEMPEQQGELVAEEIVAWRKNTIFRIEQEHTGRRVLFEQWLCRWFNRTCWAKRLLEQ